MGQWTDEKVGERAAAEVQLHDRLDGLGWLTDQGEVTVGVRAGEWAADERILLFMWNIGIMSGNYTLQKWGVVSGQKCMGGVCPGNMSGDLSYIR